MKKLRLLQFYYTSGKTVLFWIRLQLDPNKMCRDTVSCPCYVAYFVKPPRWKEYDNN